MEADKDNQNLDTVVNQHDNTSVDSRGDHGEVRVSPREPKPTHEKLEWEMKLHERDFRSSVSAWRKQANNIQLFVSDSKNMVVLKNECEQLSKIMDQVTKEYEQLDRSMACLGREGEAFDRYDKIEQDHQDLIRHMTEYMREFELEKSATKSRMSARTNQSRASDASKRVEAAAEAAMLKAKLDFVYMEAQKRAELEKIQATKELDMANAKLNAIIKTEQELVGSNDFDLEGISVPAFKGNEYVNEYIQSQQFGDTGDHTLPNETKPAPCQTTNMVLRETVSVQNPPRLNIDVNEFVPGQNTPVNAVNERPPRAMDRVSPRKQSQNTHVRTTAANSYERTDIGLLARTLTEQTQLARLPTPEPGIFSGDPLLYPAWKTAFTMLVEQKGIPPAEQIYYLKKYLGGAAKESVDGFFFLTTDGAFEEAKQLLEERYGDPFMVANAFRDKLDAWPKLSSRDGLALRKYSDFLRQCESAMRAIKGLDILNDDRENQKMLTKLPDWLVLRWGRIVAAWKEQRKMFPPFGEFVTFISKEATIACNPIVAAHTLKGSKSTSSDRQQINVGRKRSGGVSSFSTEVKEPDRNADTFCLHCERKHHVINDCRSFLQKSLIERKTFARDKGLCFACLNRGHKSKFCKQRLKCAECGKLHPTSLHGDTPGSSKPPTWARNSTGTVEATSHVGVSNGGHGGKCSMTVPVWISHCSDPNNERLVYALLDTQSDTTFILNQVSDSLGLHGTDVKLLLSTMSADSQLVDSQKLDGLTVRGYDSSLRINLPITYTRDLMPANRSRIPTPDVAKHWPHLQGIVDKLTPLLDADIGLLIGYNCAQALTPREVIPPVDNGPFGQRTDLGWGIVGIANSEDIETHDQIGMSHRILTRTVPTNLLSRSSDGTPVQVLHSFRTTVKEMINPSAVTQMMELDFIEKHADDNILSYNDQVFLDKMRDGIRLTNDSHYEMPLPFKESNPNLPNNRAQAVSRLMNLQGRFKRDIKYRDDYVNFMRSAIDSGFAEKVPSCDLLRNDGGVWYIPHHGVYHPQKPDKIRVVFDCSANFKGYSLNDQLIQGPDLTNKLVGVLCRFRQENFAFMCDIEQMFFQFRVYPAHRDFLRFLCWQNGDFCSEPVEFRMKVHLFGAVSSPGCANYGLKATANDNEAEYGSDTAEFLRRDFYVDDGLKSVSTITEATELIHKAKEMCSKGGIRLHKFVSNSKDVLATIPNEDRAKGVKDLDLNFDPLPIERALGVHWCVEADAFKFRIVLKDKPLTRRGVLSTVSSIYDPLGLVAPVVLVGKQILQEMCRDQTDWDSPLSETLRPQWEQWRDSLFHLEDLEVPRCYKPSDFGTVKSVELHHFSDASTTGYGQCTYLRLTNEYEQVHCAFVLGKARVVPLKPVTIPRLELTAAVVSVRVSSMLKQELQYENITEVFWTDSKVVLGYVTNDTRRFHVFVANRIRQIRDRSEPSQWKYVPTDRNPADYASRGLHAADLVSSRWITGPEFLWEKSIPDAPVDKMELTLGPRDPEVKANVAATQGQISEKFDLDRLKYFSCWRRAKKAIAVCLRLKQLLKARKIKFPSSKGAPGLNSTKSSYAPVQVQDLYQAELEIIRYVQRETFEDEIKAINAKTGNHKLDLKSTSPVFRLDPFLDTEGVMRVGGRLKHSQLTLNLKHPIILPKLHHVTTMIIGHYHEKACHQGRGMTTNTLRENGYWIVGCSTVVSSYISKCVTCRRLRHATREQKMSDLPPDRLEDTPPFTYCGVDLFGPWIIREGRKELKRYGVLFTCLTSRAVHIETAASLETDSFINALRRFLSIRGPIRQLRCDRGTNFVGAERELREAVNEMDQARVKEYLLRESCDFFDFKMNVPHASHMGGVWERQIRTIRNVLSVILHQGGSQLDDESLRTFMCEAAAIVNSRPLTTENLNDPNSLEPLTPNHLLTLKSKVILPPPGEFQGADLYSRKRWRRVQHLTNEFWRRWKSEYLQTLQPRPKWN